MTLFAHMFAHVAANKAQAEKAKLDLRLNRLEKRIELLEKQNEEMTKDLEKIKNGA